MRTTLLRPGRRCGVGRRQPDVHRMELAAFVVTPLAALLASVLLGGAAVGLALPLVLGAVVDVGSLLPWWVGGTLGLGTAGLWWGVARPRHASRRT